MQRWRCCRRICRCSPLVLGASTVTIPHLSFETPPKIAKYLWPKDDQKQIEQENEISSRQKGRALAILPVKSSRNATSAHGPRGAPHPPRLHRIYRKRLDSNRTSMTRPAAPVFSPHAFLRHPPSHASPLARLLPSSGSCTHRPPPFRPRLLMDRMWRSNKWNFT